MLDIEKYVPIEDIFNFRCNFSERKRMNTKITIKQHT